MTDISVDSETGGWGSQITRVKVERTSDTIKCYTTNWDDENVYQPSSEMVINLANDTVIGSHTANNGSTAIPDLAIFSGAKQYGYFTYSQPYSTYLDIELAGGISADTLILLTGGSDSDSDGNDDSWTGCQVWTYGSFWVLSGNSIQDELGYIREITNPETDKTYLIQSYKVDLVP